MSVYSVSTGYDVATLDLIAIVPQPTSAGVIATRRTQAADASVYEEGQYCELVFSALNSVTQYQALLTQFGILSSTSSPVTILVRSEIWSFTRYNGTAVRPLLGADADWQFMPRSVKILIKNLVQLVEA